MDSEEEREFREFAAARGDSLRRLAYLIGGDWHLAEDAAQTALAKLYVVWRRLHRRGEIDAYARRIVVRTVIDERRRAWFRRERVSDAVPDRPREDDNALTAERLVVWKALSTMPSRQRVAIVLRYWEDLPVEEIAALLGCPTGTVKSQTARGLQTLRGLLEPSNSTQSRSE